MSMVSVDSPRRQNLNDDEGGGGPSEDEYDALNDETFGQDSDVFDWEVAHEQLAEQLENDRRKSSNAEQQHLAAQERIEASLSQLVLDENDGSLHKNIWQNAPAPPAPPIQSVPTLKNVCTVEELERQLRAQQQLNQTGQYFQPRSPMLLQRPSSIQAPTVPFSPQSMNHMPPMNQINSLPVSNHVNQLNHNNLNASVNQFMQKTNQLPQFLQNNQIQPGSNILNQSQTNLIQNSQRNQNIQQAMNQMGQSMNQMGQTVNQMGQNMNQIGQTMNQLGQTMNQIPQAINQSSQMVPNGKFGPNVVNQMMQSHMMGQPRMVAPPPGLNLPRQNFQNTNVGQYNTNYRVPTTMPNKPNLEPINQQNILLNQQQHPVQPSVNQNQTKLNQTTQPVQNQKPIVKPMQNQQINKTNQNHKNGRSLIFNSTTQKNMTSQNLVQLIQNTHPMLQFNNSYHNASHHPMLNRNMFGQFNNPMSYNNQRHNGSYNSNRHSMNGDDCSTNAGQLDEYAGLMNQREKQWLLNIQMLQLNTGTPYVDDFYYTVFLERQSKKEKEGVKEAHKANQQNHPFYNNSTNKQESPMGGAGGRERHNSGRHNSTGDDAPTPRAYVPTQFENSLGKLQCGSVTAPRKIIDVDVVPGEASGTTTGRQSRAPSVASTTNPLEVPREIRKTKQLLLDIEALYLVLLRLEELNDPLAISNALILKEREEKQRQLELAQKEDMENENQDDDSNLFLKNIESVQKKMKSDSPKTEIVDKRQVVNLNVTSNPNAVVKNLLDEDKDELINKMFAGLLFEDRLQQFMMVRKGKALIARLCARVPSSYPRLRALWSRVFRALPAAARRDDGTLAQLAPHFRRYILNSSGWPPVCEVCAVLAEALDPARTPHALTASFTLSSICALVDKSCTLVSTPEPTASERQWTKFLKTLARALKYTSLKVARPLQPLPESKLYYHIKLLESRTTVEILPRGKTTTEFADLSKSDIVEQLTKHLC
ncbi:Protein PAT1 homolog 1 [Eumeta japonica]|uniref:Protein PAT1 homolog 1 n=1 Tax=Eumeta variegata TaxID=151549 RepID=A0A4C1X226_EUMVA|nr:Protein PAT1 homolog 1 [Eumeta japonica]